MLPKYQVQDAQNEKVRWDKSRIRAQDVVILQHYINKQKK